MSVQKAPAMRSCAEHRSEYSIGYFRIAMREHGSIRAFSFNKE